MATIIWQRSTYAMAQAPRCGGATAAASSFSSGPMQGPSGCAATVRAVGAEGSWWPPSRDPSLLESSVPGIFACGDVRLSPVKRVASAVGEGSMAIAFVHRYLQQDAR